MTRIVERATDLQFRIWAEFRTMPGLRLTRNQACRLFGGESNTVIEALQDLVDAAVLRQIGPYYVRADIGSFTA
jgi:nicotinate-nucleotide pyrophosphorylase